MNCLICGSNDLETKDTIISDFVMARIDPHFESRKVNHKTKLCFCRDCTFAFYEYRLNLEEEQKLYRNYRDSEYQKTREKYECWYTKKVNDAINTGGAEKQRNLIKKNYYYKDIVHFKQLLTMEETKVQRSAKNLEQ